jgi:hypothetical protein
MSAASTRLLRESLVRVEPTEDAQRWYLLGV